MKLDLTPKTITALADAICSRLVEVELAKLTGQGGSKCKAWHHLTELKQTNKDK